MKSHWGWLPERTQGIWRHGAVWFRPITMVSPWAALVLCLLTLHVVGGALTSARGLLFELPVSGQSDAEATQLVALMLPMGGRTTVIFDDARYQLEDGRLPFGIVEHLTDRILRTSGRTLLVLADRRIPYGEIEEFASVARRCGAERLLFANKREELDLE